MNILTWNSQGYSADIGYPDLLSKCSVDILCLQECGKLEDSRINFERTPMEGKITKGEYKLGTRSRGYNIYNVYYYKLLGVGNERCNMAIFVKNNLHFIKAMVTYKELTQGGESWNRPLLGVELDDIYVFTSHLPSNGDKSAFNRSVGITFLKHIEDVSSAKNAIFLGDMNQKPDSVKTYWTDPVVDNYTIYAPHSATQTSGNVLDYAFFKTKSAHPIPDLFQLPPNIDIYNMINSDHFPVGFTLERNK